MFFYGNDTFRIGFFTVRFTRPRGRRVPFVRRLGENHRVLRNVRRVFRKPFTRSAAAVFPFGLSFLRHGPSTTRPPPSSDRVDENRVDRLHADAHVRPDNAVLLAKFARNFFFFYTLSLPYLKLKSHTHTPVADPGFGGGRGHTNLKVFLVINK